MTAAFADAWTFVDAVDRYRSLYRLVPGFAELRGPPIEREHAFSSQLAAVRSLRNVADHIATRIDQVLAMRMPVLGALSWFVADADMSGGKICTLAPGSVIGKNTVPAVNAAGKVGRLEASIGEQTTGMDHSSSDTLIVMSVAFQSPPALPS